MIVLKLSHVFILGFLLNMAFVAVETAFGIIADSLALLADAGHNLTDMLALVLAWGAEYLTKRPPSHRHTYGWQRASILAAVINTFILLVIIGGIGWEAIRRLQNPPPITGLTILWVASVGVVINSLTALLFAAGRKTDLNVRAVFINKITDEAGWAWLDPAMSLVVGGVVVFSTWGVFKESFYLSMDAVPAGIDAEKVRRYLSCLPGVSEVHDLHIWALSTSKCALTAHLVKPESENDDALIKEASTTLHENFGIEHITLQWERRADSYQCETPQELKEQD
jgi:cobalt-zinc-cadmium efflux system protein